MEFLLFRARRSLKDAPRARARQGDKRSNQKCLQRCPQRTSQTPAGHPLPTQDAAATTYIRLLQILRKLTTVYELLRQPQERESLGGGIRLCAGLVTEAWAAVVQANGGTDVVDMEHLLIPLNLVPEDLEVPLPAALREVRAEQLAGHRREVEHAALAAAAAAAAAGADSAAGGSQAQLGEAGASHPQTHKAKPPLEGSFLATNRSPGTPSPEPEAVVAAIQAA